MMFYLVFNNMVDKITKSLNKFSQKERDLIKKIISKINDKNLKGLNLKKLKDRDDIYRVRKGKIRIIYRVKNEKIKLLTIERRKESTYKNI